MPRPDARPDRAELLSLGGMAISMLDASGIAPPESVLQLARGTLRALAHARALTADRDAARAELARQVAGREVEQTALRNAIAELAQRGEVVGWVVTKPNDGRPLTYEPIHQEKAKALSHCERLNSMAGPRYFVAEIRALAGEDDRGE